MSRAVSDVEAAGTPARAVAGADPSTEAELVVRVEHEEGRPVVEVDGAGVAVSFATADRIGALGGETASTPAGLRVELPCES